MKQVSKISTEKEEDFIFRNIEPDYYEAIQRRCRSLLEVVNKYLTENKGDFSEYNKCKKRFNQLSKWAEDLDDEKQEKSVDGLGFSYYSTYSDHFNNVENMSFMLSCFRDFKPSENEEGVRNLLKDYNPVNREYLYHSFKCLRDYISSYMYDEIGYDKIKKYIPSDMRLQKPKSLGSLTDNIGYTDVKFVKETVIPYRIAQLKTEVLYAMKHIKVNFMVDGVTKGEILKIVDAELKKRKGDKTLPEMMAEAIMMGRGEKE